ncbi:MAG TPA: amidophosphoribosyltransferase [Thermomicrobiales bacterium]|nr:amidophosphoribosyltransferase [Thermomicrobiales bacterium]
MLPAEQPQLDGDTLHEECGVFGIVAPGEDVARISYFALYALQHRGQESAGIATFDGTQLHAHHGMGLVAQAFDEESLADLPGTMAIGHTRYSTAGSNRADNAGPMITDSDIGPVAVSHNGNLTNALELREELEAEGEEFVTTTDSEVLARVIARAPGLTIVDRIRNAMRRLVGAFSLAVLAEGRVFAVRDPYGVRPLSIGTLNGHKVVASETCAMMTIGAEVDREVEPGEIIEIREGEILSHGATPADREALCLFEMIYFARPDSEIHGKRLHQVRQAMGRELYREHPVDADVVIGLPDSATPATIGYAKESGIPYAEALIKNRYIGRTFIQPNQMLRERGVSLKFNVVPEVVEGKRVILVDDTIVRGTTSRPIVNLIREAGAREVHMRVHAPPIMWPCYLGVDLARKEELIAARLSVPEIGQELGVDSIAYLSLDGLFRAIGESGSGYCTGCLTGNYPVPAFTSLDKLALEHRSVQRAKVGVRA